MTTTVAIKRLATGVPGLDLVLGGGLPEFSLNLIAGQPGSGKTTLAHQIMFALATPERPAIYFTVLGEPPLKMLRYQQQFSFFDSDALGGRVRFISLSEDAGAGQLDRVLQRIRDEVTKHSPALVFVDSFRSVMQASDVNNPSNNAVQEFIQQLGMLMTAWQATSFLIGEYVSELDANPVFTVADGLIWMRQSVLRNSMVRKLEVLKMRGQATLPGLHTFRIGANGLTVFAPAGSLAAIEAEADDPKAATATITSRLSLGVPGLDEMLGGGLPCGYSLLVAGPSGSGKTILASSFLAEGARVGEFGIVASFEQRPNRTRSQIIVDLIAQGKVALLDNQAAELSIDEITFLLMDHIRRVGAKRLVIDSLTGFELTLAPTFRADFREALLRMVTAFSAIGVTVLLTSELEDRYTDLRFSPYGSAFLTDAIIVQRYIEVESKLLRVMAAVKVRASSHSNELRAYTIDSNGIQLGGMLTGQEGLLGGRPTRKREGEQSDDGGKARKA